MLDLAASGPVRRRFGLDDDDLATMTRWVSDSGIRWGYDQAGRAPFALDVEPQGTWRFGLDRLLVGVTVSADGPLQVGGVMPLDDVGSGSVDLVGRVSEDRLLSAGLVVATLASAGVLLVALVVVTALGGAAPRRPYWTAWRRHGKRSWRPTPSTRGDTRGAGTT